MPISINAAKKDRKRRQFKNSLKKCDLCGNRTTTRMKLGEDWVCQMCKRKSLMS